MKRIYLTAGDEPGRPVSEDLILDLVKLRKRRKIAQEMVAREIGITQGGLSQMESLKTSASFESIFLYARAIGANIVVESRDSGKKKSA